MDIRKQMKDKPVRLDNETHSKLTMEMALSGRNRKAIVKDAIDMYLAFKKSERLLPMSERIFKEKEK